MQATDHLAQGERAAQQTVMDGEPLLAEVKALALFAKHVGDRDADIVEIDDVLSRTVPGPDALGIDGEAGGVAVHQEHGDAATLTLRRIRHRLQHDEIGLMRHRNPHLGAVDHPEITIANGLGGHHATGIGAGARLGLAEAGVLLPLNDRRQILLDLIALAGIQNVGVADRLARTVARALPHARHGVRLLDLSRR